MKATQLTRTIELIITTKKEICDIYKQNIEVIYIGSEKIASIRKLQKDERSYFEARSNENFYVTFYGGALEKYGFNKWDEGLTKKKKSFYKIIENTLQDYLKKLLN